MRRLFQQPFLLLTNIFLHGHCTVYSGKAHSLGSKELPQASAHLSQAHLGFSGIIVALIITSTTVCLQHISFIQHSNGTPVTFLGFDATNCYLLNCIHFFSICNFRTNYSFAAGMFYSDVCIFIINKRCRLYLCVLHKYKMSSSSTPVLLHHLQSSHNCCVYPFVNSK